jgi:hypothetical protein
MIRSGPHLPIGCEERKGVGGFTGSQMNCIQRTQSNPWMTPGNDPVCPPQDQQINGDKAQHSIGEV